MAEATTARATEPLAHVRYKDGGFAAVRSAEHKLKPAEPEAQPVIRRAPSYVAAYQDSLRLEIFTTSPVCGAWMNWPPPM